MHLIIAHRIAEQLPILFFQGALQDYSRHIDYASFLDKYEAYASSPYVWGYATYSVADDIWLKGFYLPWLKNRIEADVNVVSQYHNDFTLLNGPLFEHYGLKHELRRTFRFVPTVLDLQEVSSVDVEAFVPIVLGDLADDQEVRNAPLRVFTFTQIIGYIETSIDKAMQTLKPLLS